ERRAEQGPLQGLKNTLGSLKDELFADDDDWDDWSRPGRDPWASGPPRSPGAYGAEDRYGADSGYAPARYEAGGYEADRYEPDRYEPLRPERDRDVRDRYAPDPYEQSGYDRNRYERGGYGREGYDLDRSDASARRSPAEAALPPTPAGPDQPARRLRSRVPDDDPWGDSRLP
ncbi:MAG: molecular chaperone DnaK, partial [Prochlorococcaceae cyanobacterium]